MDTDAERDAQISDGALLVWLHGWIERVARGEASDSEQPPRLPRWLASMAPAERAEWLRDQARQAAHDHHEHQADEAARRPARPTCMHARIGAWYRRWLA